MSIRVGDGREGWADHAPYETVYLTCVVRAFPPALVEQTRPGELRLASVGMGSAQGRERLCLWNTVVVSARRGGFVMDNSVDIVFAPVIDRRLVAGSRRVAMAGGGGHRCPITQTTTPTP